MLLKRVRELPHGPQWQYEVKWDGYRMQAIKHSGKVWLFSRNGADYTSRFPSVAQAVLRLKPTTLHMDGELVAVDREGRPSFQTLQGRSRLPPGWQVSYYAFDLLHLGQDCMLKTALSERLARLQDVVNASAIRFSSTLEGSADQVIKAVRDHRLEGVVAKRVDSLYEPGKRSLAWVKMPLKQSGRFFIGGFRPAGDILAVLLVGQFDSGRFKFAGKVRHGFGKRGRAQALKALSQLATGKCPFSDLPNCKADPFDEMVTAEEMTGFSWVKPEVAVDIAFAEWTRFGVLRHAELTALAQPCRGHAKADGFPGVPPP